LPDKVTAKMMLDFETDPNEKAKLTQKINDMKNTLGITDDDAAAKIIITSKIKSEDVPKIANKKFWQNKDVMYGIQRYWGGGKLRKGAEQFEGEFIEDYMKPIERKLKHYKTLPPRQAEKAYKAYIYVNPARARYLETTAAQELGFGSVWAYAPDIVRRRYGSLRKLMAER